MIFPFELVLLFGAGSLTGYAVGLRYRSEEERCSALEEKRCSALQGFCARTGTTVTRRIRCSYRKDHQGPHRCWHPYEHGFHSWKNKPDAVDELVERTENRKERERK